MSNEPICDDESDDVVIWLRGTEYAPPWLDLDTGQWYGPASQSIYQTQVEEYNQTRAGGGLWDEETHVQMHGRKSPPLSGFREDFDAITEYVNSHSGDLPMREIEIYYLFWVKGMTGREIALELEITEGAVHSLISRLRSRLGRAKPKMGRPRK